MACLSPQPPRSYRRHGFLHNTDPDLRHSVLSSQGLRPAKSHENVAMPGFLKDAIAGRVLAPLPPASTPQRFRAHPPLRFPRQSPQSSTLAAVPCSTRLGTSANRNRNIHGSGHEPPLVLSPMWRPHGNHRETNCRSNPTSLPTQGVDSCSMKSLSHFANFTPSAALRRLVSSPRTARSFTPLVMINTTLQHQRTATSDHSPATPAPAPSLLRLHSIPIDPPRPPQTRAASF